MSEPVASSFDDVFLAEHAGLVRLATVMCGSPARAEELVQDAFAGAWTRWDELQRPGAYLRRSVVNATINATRRRERSEEPLPEADPVAPDAPPPDTDLLAVLDELPPVQRAVVVLRFYLDLPLAEIAEAVDRPLNTVKSDLRRALAALSGELIR